MPKLKYGNGTISVRYRKRKNGTVRRFYQGRLYIDGKQRTVYGKTQKECLEKLNNLRKERDEKLRERTRCAPPALSAPIAAEPPAPAEQYETFNSWLDEWVNECKLNNIKETYIPDFLKNVDRVRAALGNIPLKNLTSMDVQKYINSLPRRNISRKLYDIVNGSLQTAEDFGIIGRNPARAVKRPTFTAQKRRAFELGEQSQIYDALNGKHKQAFLFLCCTGLRIGEFLALTEKDVDFNRGVINVTKALNGRTRTIETPKTAAGIRRVYFAPALFEHFDISLLGSFTYSGIKKAFSKVYRVLGLKGVSVTHSCRHTYASIMYALGIPDKIIQKQLGHATISTTLDTYTDILLNGDSPVYEYAKLLKSTLTHTLSFEKF